MPLILLFLGLLLTEGLGAAELAGRVVAVLGPLELELVTDAGARQPLVLQGIQADPRRPDNSDALRLRLQGLVAGRFVRISTQGERDQGRLLGFVDWGGKEVNLTLIEDGLAIPLAGQLDAGRLAIYETAAARAKERILPVQEQQSHGPMRWEFKPAPLPPQPKPSLQPLPQSPGSARH